jgi:hypothetical protein
MQVVGNRDYSKSKIYKIIDNTNQNIYIGSTIKPLSQRLSKHKTSYKRYLNGTHSYMTSFEIIKNRNYNIVLLEECPTILNIEQLHARERYWIELLECINKNIPGRSKKEYYQDNKEQISEKDKIYYQENKEKKIEYSKKYRQDNQQKIQQYQQKRSEKFICQCSGKFTLGHKSTHLKSIKHQKYLQNNK